MSICNLVREVKNEIESKFSLTEVNYLILKGQLGLWILRDKSPIHNVSERTYVLGYGIKNTDRHFSEKRVLGVLFSPYQYKKFCYYVLGRKDAFEWDLEKMLDFLKEDILKQNYSIRQLRVVYCIERCRDVYYPEKEYLGVECKHDCIDIECLTVCAPLECLFRPFVKMLAYAQDLADNIRSRIENELEYTILQVLY